MTTEPQADSLESIRLSYDDSVILLPVHVEGVFLEGLNQKETVAEVLERESVVGWPTRLQRQRLGENGLTDLESVYGQRVYELISAENNAENPYSINLNPNFFQKGIDLTAVLSEAFNFGIDNFRQADGDADFHRLMSAILSNVEEEFKTAITAAGLDLDTEDTEAQAEDDDVMFKTLVKLADYGSPIIRFGDSSMFNKLVDECYRYTPDSSEKRGGAIKLLVQMIEDGEDYSHSSGIGLAKLHKEACMRQFAKDWIDARLPVDEIDWLE